MHLKMKKSICALMGLFTLVACSEDAYQEADKMKDTGIVDNSGAQNSIRTVDGAIPYESPYDLAGNDRIEYIFQNDTDLELSFHSFIELCFYDGVNDNIHFGHNLSSGGYPLFTLSSIWNEYRTMLTANIITIAPHTRETITMSGGKILPVDPSGPITASGQYFELGSSATGPLTNPEMDFLGEFAKFVGMEGNIRDLTTGNVVGGTAIRFPLAPTAASLPVVSPGSLWQDVPYLASHPSPNQKIYNTQSGEICMTTAGASTSSLANRPASYTFTYNGNSYTWSAYTTQNEVVVLLQ